MRQLLATLIVAASLGGCATAPVGASGDALDPWENWNRKVYAFNETIDENLLKPVATAYADAVPRPVRTGINNVFNNVSDAWSAINNLLQGKFGNAMQDVVRVGTNTLFGIFGIFDVASELGIDPQYEDLGQTLGHWGFGPGAYVVWPLLGPSTVRDSVALPLDQAATPATAFSDSSTQYSLAALSIVNRRANLLGATKLLDDIALDKYTFVRDAYLQRRRSLVLDGAEPPQEPENPATPAATPASAPGR